MHTQAPLLSKETAAWRNFTAINTQISNDHPTQRFFSSEGEATATAESKGDYEFQHTKSKEMFDKMSTLSTEEIKLISQLINEKLGITITEADKRGGMGSAGSGGGGDASGSGGGAEEAVVEKTAFDLKLTGFDAKSKIKVIKEIRAITGLGLKEAKALVEEAPKTVKKDLKMEECEELKAKLEAVGGTVEID